MPLGVLSPLLLETNSFRLDIAVILRLYQLIGYLADIFLIGATNSSTKLVSFSPATHMRVAFIQ